MRAPRSAVPREKLRAPEPTLTCRRSLLLAAAVASSPGWSWASDADDLRRLQQQLYAPLPEVQPFTSQVSDAIRLKSMRGVWRLRESDKSGRVTEGWLVRRSHVEPAPLIDFRSSHATASVVADLSRPTLRRARQRGV